MKIIAIDFDGTIVEDKYPEIGDLKQGAKEYINKLKQDGFWVIIWTCRTGEKLIEAITFLANQGIMFDLVNRNLQSNIEKYGGDTRKIYADFYIDDKNLFHYDSWEQTYKHIVAAGMPRKYSDKVIEEGHL
jgi:hydroxymethylpyrimidine pyrophosphatase-like HAD family hydrolase